MTPKLTLNLGVRYELWSPIGEQFARQSNFDFNTLTLEIPKGPNQNAPLPPNFNTPYTVRTASLTRRCSRTSMCARGKVRSIPDSVG